MAWAAVAAMAAQATSSILQGVSGFQRGRAEATQLRQLGKLAVQERKYEASALLGKQRAAFAKSGVDPGTGSPADVAAATAAREALGVELVRTQYKTAEQEARTAAGASLLSGLLLGGAQGAQAGAAWKLGPGLRGWPSSGMGTGKP